MPIIQVQVDLRRQRAWYVWLQGWLLKQRRVGKGPADLPKKVSVRVPASKTLAAGLRGELQDIARWSTTEQLGIGLNDTIRTAASLLRHDVLLPILHLLSKLDESIGDFPLEIVIDQAVSLGPELWGTSAGNQASHTLYAVCRALGPRFSVEQIAKMVLRAGTYSRTGINALGAL